MNLSIKPETILETVKTICGTIQYAADKKSDASRYHDDTLKEMNQLDNTNKTKWIKLILGALTPLIVAGAFRLKGEYSSEKEKIEDAAATVGAEVAEKATSATSAMEAEATVASTVSTIVAGTTTAGLNSAEIGKTTKLVEKE